VRYLVLAAATAASLILVGAAAAMPDSSETPVAAPPPVLILPPTILTPPPVTPATPASPGSGSEGGSGTVTLPTGCRTIDFFAEQKSFLFHVRIYRFHQIKHWCWRNGVVYDERHAWTFEGSATACFDSVYPDNSWFFTWWKNKANSGHFSEERAHVTNCVFHFGDWKEFYPDVKIWAYADGTYTVSTQN
jgi:hypothetical protein